MFGIFALFLHICTPVFFEKKSQTLKLHKNRGSVDPTKRISLQPTAICQTSFGNLWHPSDHRWQSKKPGFEDSEWESPVDLMKVGAKG